MFHVSNFKTRQMEKSIYTLRTLQTRGVLKVESVILGGTVSPKATPQHYYVIATFSPIGLFSLIGEVCNLHAILLKDFFLNSQTIF